VNKLNNAKPMLAVEVDFNKLRFPIYAQPKLDGIRVIIKDGVVYSRSLKPIPNQHIQSLFGHLNGVDGELIVGSVTAQDVFQKTTSGVMSRDGEPDVILYAFDVWDKQDYVYISRHQYLNIKCCEECNVSVVPYECINTQEDLLAYADEQIALGYEGIMLRSVSAKYKYGRATTNTQELLKYKLFTDAEFECVGVEELMHNENELKTDELGYAERSSCKEGMKPSGMLGALVLKYTDVSSTFKVGTGFTEQQRKELFNSSIVGEMIKVKYQASGMKDLAYEDVEDRKMNLKAQTDMTTTSMRLKQRDAIDRAIQLYKSKEENKND
jgi:DNA ligase-1